MKTVWITGGGSGIGRTLAIKMCRAGHRVYISGRNEDKLQEVGQGTHPVACDITKEEDIKRALKEIGPVDLAILNAGTYEPGSVEDTKLASFHQAMEVNYFGTIKCIQAILPQMKEKGGHLAVVASLAGYRGLPNASGYGPSKAAVISLCESLKAELADSRVKFQLINPGFVKSPLTDKNDFQMPYLMEPVEAAAAIAAGLQKDSFEIAFPKPFVRQMKILRLLPYRWFFSLMRKVTKS
ncbi:SDR family NAD(P)-dependent oxidoreductase [Terasakiella sp. A23]|uniref:SDR family NAD(P)-dependent oxidoreductase n=1 Tax=Terasakiella sp. FCG-A23 TaxID=3080561 RepID=UPI002952BF9D|nr:SDR family NAD(P)-dependent oxidoreductase [Terasakiella sp. A23]MDV7341274.1 SDR family NAD(P)-dependent oxidoreductase [Terasakiella sp. A23]